MLLPLCLILLALAAAGVVAYGTLPYWGQFEHGLQLILLSRRMQWPLIVVCLIACVALIALVVGGKGRAWWLIGLLPVLAMFYRWTHHGGQAFVVLDNPPFVSVEQARGFLHDDDHVVGVLLGETWYAYPYATLFSAPIVVQPEQGRRMMLLWSPYANHATAVMIDRDLKPREMEVVGMPANAMLVYNARYGQFINGLTGLTTKGQRPMGFGKEISTGKMRWGLWRGLHPQGKVLAATGKEQPEASKPLEPAYPIPSYAALRSAEPGMRVAMLATTRPVAVVCDDVTKAPENFVAGDTAVVMFRDEVSGQLRVFDREIGEQLRPRFKLANNPRKPAVYMTDGDTGCGWDRNGVAVDGDRTRRGQKLTRIAVEEELDWAVMKYWRPGLELRGAERVGS